MKITVAGKQLKVGAALKEYVEEHLELSIKKYFEKAISADVHFSKETHMFVTDIVVNEGTGNQIFYKSQAKEESIYASFDKASERMEKQLRRYKRRLKDRSDKQPLREIADLVARKSVIQDDGQDVEDENPLIIAEKQTSIERLTVADAVMHMNLANLPALVFVNKKTDEVNVVYKRSDGNISWVETSKESTQAA